jgi:hypothetical protein
MIGKNITFINFFMAFYACNLAGKLLKVYFSCIGNVSPGSFIFLLGILIIDALYKYENAGDNKDSNHSRAG